jgi:hypothetical protein
MEKQGNDMYSIETIERVFKYKRQIIKKFHDTTLSLWIINTVKRQYIWRVV